MPTPSFFTSPSAGGFSPGHSSGMGIPRSPIRSMPQSIPVPSRPASINPVSRGVPSNISVAPSAPSRSIPLQTQVVKDVPQVVPARTPAPENVLLQKQAFVRPETIEARVEEVRKNNKNPEKLASEITQVFFDVVAEHKGAGGFSRIAKALPKDTEWANIHFKIIRWDADSSKVFARIYIQDDFFDVFTYTDAHITNKNGTVPNIGIILCLLALGQKFSWLSDKAPDTIRQAKRLLQGKIIKFMDMDPKSKPFYRLDHKKEYYLRMKITADESVKKYFEHFDGFATGEAINRMLEKLVKSPK